MKAVVFLRIASVLTFVHAILHTVGGVFGQPAPGPQQAAVTAMKANQFPLMGHTRSYWDFYMGMGLGASIFLTMSAVVFWQLGSLARSPSPSDSIRLRPIYATFAVAYLVFAVDSWRYFFVLPVVTEVLIALCLIAAFFTSRATAANH